MENASKKAADKPTGKEAPKDTNKNAPKEPAAKKTDSLPGTENNPDGGAIPPPPPQGEPPPSGESAPNADDKAAAPEALEIGAIPIGKINPKDVMGKKMKEVTTPETGIYDLFTIIGTAANLRDGESAFGPWTALVGEFEATRLSDGQRYISTQCFVPGAAGELLVAQVRKFVIEEIPVTAEQFKKTGKTYKVTGETVEMALIVGIKKAQRDGGANYEYVIRPVVPVQKSDPLSALRNRLKSVITEGAVTLSLPPPPPKPAAPALNAPPPPTTT